MDDREVPWQQFERVAARIERLLAPAGAIVKVNDRLPDLKTGSSRQIDATIRYRVGSVDILITMECRRHNDPQDVTWIEQLAKKRENVGANATIAVASAGFYRTAGVSAEFENVYLRTLEELESTDFTEWLKTKHVDVIIRTYSIDSVGVELYDPFETDEIVYNSEPQSKFATTLDCPVFIRTSDGQRFNAYEPIKMSEQLGADWFDKCVEGIPVTHNLKWENQDRGISVETNHGLKAARYIYLRFATLLERKQIPIAHTFRYSAGDNVLADGVEFDLSPISPGAALAVLRDKENGTAKVQMITSATP